MSGITQKLRVNKDACPACGEAFFLRSAGVVTGAFRLSAKLVGRGKPRGELGRCSSCGVRLTVCPECLTPNGAPNLLESIECRYCGEEFQPG